MNESALEPVQDSPTNEGAFSLHLSNFEGPFDLLLQLISKHKMDVTEVALGAITDEFIAYIKGVEGGKAVSYTHLTLPTICSV